MIIIKNFHINSSGEQGLPAPPPIRGGKGEPGLPGPKGDLFLIEFKKVRFTHAFFKTTIKKR